MYLIWSHEHKAWWMPHRCGYTTDRALAGHYDFGEAADITVGHIPPGEEVAVPESYAERFQAEQDKWTNIREEEHHRRDLATDYEFVVDYE